MRAVAVWGCGTGIGKTLLSAGLMRAAAARGAPALFVKPVQTGVPDSDGATVARLRGSSCRHEPAAHAAEAGLGVFTSANGGAAPLTRVTTLFAWRAPISPHLASAREGRPVSDGEVVRATSAELQAFEAAVRAAGTAAGVTARTAANAAPAVESGVQAGSGIVVSGRDPNSAVEGAVAVVETAGGVSSPGPSGSIQCDILSPLGLPALLVGDARLGGISATLCAAEALTARGHALAAVVLFEEAGAAEELGNAEALRWHLGGLREGGKGGAGSGGISMSSAAVGGAVGGGGGGGAQGSAPTPRLLSREGGVPVIQVEAPPPMPEPLDAWMERNAPAFESILMRIAHGTRGREKGVGGRADGAGEVAQATEGERRAAVTQEATAAPQAAVDDSAAGTVPSGCPFLLSRASPLPPSRDASALLAADSRLLWHPYTSTTRPAACMPVARAKGVHLFLADGTRLLDGMSSWWAAIHGYGVPEIDAAAASQLGRMGHVMFGGITHAPAVELAQRLVAIAPPGLDRVFLADSGSVAVEVAIKMALQFWRAQGAPLNTRGRLLTVRGGYHGDTFGAMAVCDPVNGMHARLFEQVLPKHLFAPIPSPAFGAPCQPADVEGLRALMRKHKEEVAAVILEPVVQGAGGMRFYSADYLREVRSLCDETGALLILDEIATGFGRTGELFACDHAGVTPDIMCIGKALTGGYITLGATLATTAVANGASGGASSPSPVPLMHGPTFMANPLACAIAIASLDLLISSGWRERVAAIGAQLKEELEPCRRAEGVRDVRTLGAIGVVEMKEEVDVQATQALLASHGVWLRPFGKLLYTMPPFVMGEDDLRTVTAAMRAVVRAA